MRVVIQRVQKCEVISRGEILGQIGPGLLILLGIEHEDGAEDVHWLIEKIAALRVFADAEGKMNLDIRQTGGSVLVVSQFTLHASTRKGNRPSFIKAARPEQAIPLYESFVAMFQEMGIPVRMGRFGANMQVSLINDGPVTILMDSKQKE